MRLFSLVCITAINILCLGGIASSEPPAPVAEKADRDGPISQLEVIGFPFQCATLDKDGMNIRAISDLSKADPGDVEHIQIRGKAGNHRDEFPQLPVKVFEILPLFPNLQSVRFESCYLDPDELRRLKEIPGLRSFAVHHCCKGSRKSFKDDDDLDFLKELPDLESLRLTSSCLRNEMIESLLPLKSLRRLNLGWNDKLTHAILPTLEKLPSLESLNMSYTRFAAPRMEARRFAARLKRFSYSPSYLSRSKSQSTFSLEDLREIVTLPRHTWRHLHKTNVPLADIVALLPGPITRVGYTSYRMEMSLEGIDSSDRHFKMCLVRSLSDKDLVTIGKMVELRSLAIETESVHAKEFQVAFTDDGLRKLTGLAKLEQLKIVVDRYHLSAREQPYYLTTRSLAALSKMPSLVSVTLSPVNFGHDSLAWVRTTPKLSNLTLRKGIVAGDSLADLADAKSLQRLNLGHDNLSPSLEDSSISITKPTRPFTINNLIHLSMLSRHLFVDGYEAVGRMKALRSLTLNGPVTDANLKQLKTLTQLRRLSIRGEGIRREGVPEGELTPRSLMHFRGVQSHLSLNTPVSMPYIEQPMADQFNWFIDWGCGCCGSEGMPGIDWWPEDMDSSPLRAKKAESQKEERFAGKPEAIRLRGPMASKRLTIRRKDIPPSVHTLCLTDCRIESLHLEGWLPKSIRLWGDSRIDRILSPDAPNDAAMELGYYLLEGQNKLTVPALKNLTKIVVAQCEQLERIELAGNYPNLKSVELRSLDRLKAFIVRHPSNVPKLEYPSDRHWKSNLPSLRYLFLPGTAIGRVLPKQMEISKPNATNPSRWFPQSVTNIDLGNTAITDEWLEQLATIPSLRYLRIGGCTNLTAEAIATFRTSRPRVFLNQKVVD